MKYKNVEPGEWIRPRPKGYKMMCCDCGLVHVIDFKIIKSGNGRYVRFKAIRDNRATAASRKHRTKKF